MKTLEEIKKEIEKEWSNTINDFISRDQYLTLDQIIDEVAKRFAIEVSKAALENAAKNVKLSYRINYSVIDKFSITDERNIPKI